MAVVLRGPKHDDCVRWMSLVAHRPIADLAVDVDTVNEERDKDGKPREYPPFKESTHHPTRLSIRPLKKLCSVSNETGPSRSSTGGSTVMSNSVDPPRTGNDPPSTKTSRLSSNWDRISSAVIADGKPVLFALVA